MTKDERYLIELYRMLKDPEGVVDPSDVSKSLKLSERQSGNILKGLMQANLVKRYSPEEIGLTDRGIQVAQAMLK